MLILVDQDNVLADFDAGFRAAWGAAHPEAPGVAEVERRAWNFRDDLPETWRAAAMRVYSASGFFRSLPVIPGGREALEKMLELGWNVRICTSPIEQYQNCVAERFAWLIDDKVEITGSHPPSWRHALFDAHHNRRAAHPVRVDWRNWYEVLTTPPD